MVSVHLNIQIFIDDVGEEGDLMLDHLLSGVEWIFVGAFSEHLVGEACEYFSHWVVADIHIHEVLKSEVDLSYESRIIVETVCDELFNQKHVFSKVFNNLRRLN